MLLRLLNFSNASGLIWQNNKKTTNKLIDFIDTIVDKYIQKAVNLTVDNIRPTWIHTFSTFRLALYIAVVHA
jgi:hypothetical protein